METESMKHADVLYWIETYHYTYGYIPTLVAIMHGCKIGYSWATVCRNDYEKSLVAKCLNDAPAKT
jgi:hypothetical protein